MVALPEQLQSTKTRKVFQARSLGAALALLAVVLLALGQSAAWATTYYSTPSGSFGAPNVVNWRTAPDGTETHPANSMKSL
jgi:hypothetical protein